MTIRFRLLLAVIVSCAGASALAANLKALPGHVPSVVAGLTPKARLAATNELRLAIGLPMRDAAGLGNFVAQVSDPSSPNFRHYLTREQLTARFGPTMEDYEAVKKFAVANGLTIAATNANRLVLDVTGPAAVVEKAFHVTLHTYRHPTEDRDFFAPDVEPTVDRNLPVADIQGLTDYWRPHPKKLPKHVIRRALPKIVANGTAPDASGDLFGNDFRNAYAPGTTLTGAGQSVGLVEFDGWFTNDIFSYASQAGNGRTNIVIQTVLLDSYSGKPSTGVNGGEGEVELDIEMAMAIAPGLSRIVSFEAGESGIQNDVLNAMLMDSNVLNLSCSWGWAGPSNSTDVIFESMDAVGQTFFNASGDSGAFTPGATSVNGVDNPKKQNSPSSNPYITQVGGTTLLLNGPGTAWASEAAWKHFSSGGISSFYPIPNWQTNVSNLLGRGGSTTNRNIPDVAACADNIYELYNNGDTSPTAVDDNQGTSAAAPLWAGFIALVNQQAAAHGGPSAGFINPALYSIAAGTNYQMCFHDIIAGSNVTTHSPNLFYATNNYDLVTGLGAMTGTNLINALTVVPPAPAFLAPVLKGNNFILTWASVTGQTYQLQFSTNLGTNQWSNFGSGTNATGGFISETDSISGPRKFYRVMLP